MSSVFDVRVFTFPYAYKFPGQGTDERILWITRESPVLLWVRLAGVLLAAATLLVTGWALGSGLRWYGQEAIAGLIQLAAMVMCLVFVGVGWWWVHSLWLRSLALVTTNRLVKFIYTTPFNRHTLSLPLDMVVDTGAYSKGFIQALFGLGTFTARSSAASSGAATDDPERINKKYFYIENIAHFEDLQHYINKLLAAFRHRHQDLTTFRPFIPGLKGEHRRQFMEQFPEYWS